MPLNSVDCPRSGRSRTQVSKSPVCDGRRKCVIYLQHRQPKSARDMHSWKWSLRMTSSCLRPFIERAAMVCLVVVSFLGSGLNAQSREQGTREQTSRPSRSFRILIDVNQLNPDE